MFEIQIDGTKQIMCTIYIPDTLCEVIFVFDQNVTHFVMSQSVINDIIVA